MKKIIHTDNAPAAVGPYSQANMFERLIFTSGQIPLDPTTGKVVEGGLDAQVRRTLDNLKAVLEEAGADLNSVLKTTCFLDTIEDFAAFNKIYTEYFGTETPPARSCFEVGNLPLGVLVEVEAIAYKK